jgi:hypothetical protein
MSPRVGPVIAGSYLQEQDRVPEELRGPQVSSTMDTNFILEQGKPRCMPIPFPSVESLLYQFMHVNILCTYV